MTTPSFRDVEQLSAFLDGQLSQGDAARLDIRIKSDPDLATALADLRQARAILRRSPMRRPPRNFTLTPKMAGVKPPIPRAVPALGWASAVAMVLFAFTLGTNLLSKISFGAAAPMRAAAPMNSEGYGLGGGPVATQPASTDNTQITPTAETPGMAAAAPTPSSETRIAIPGTTTPPKAAPEPANLWLYIWLGLAVALIITAVLIHQANDRSFRHKAGGKSNK